MLIDDVQRAHDLIANCARGSQLIAANRPFHVHGLLLSCQTRRLQSLACFRVCLSPLLPLPTSMPCGHLLGARSRTGPVTRPRL